MTDLISKKKRSCITSIIEGKGTKSEIIVHKYLFHCDFRFCVNVKHPPGTPDIILRKYKTTISTSGCFWHGHKGCPEFRSPYTRVEWRTEKLNRNKVRDARVRKELRAVDWNMTVTRECQLELKEQQTTLGNAVRLLEKTYMESTYHTKSVPVYPLLEEGEPPKVAEEEISYENVRHY